MWLATWIGIQVIFGLPQQCMDLNYIGCYYPGTKVVYVTRNKTRKPKEYVLYHEIGHLCGYKSESNADLYADYWYDGTVDKKNPRDKEFVLMTQICKKRLSKGDLPNK
jgi:hypothetical protein